MAAVAYGHVAIVPKGIWNADTQYEVCQLVEYDGSSYVAKAQPPVGTLPTDTSYWQVSAAGTKKASSGSLGTVMPDGSTTEVNEEGKLSAKTAQQNALGVVKGSDDITVGEDGNLTVNTTFEQATEIANIIAGEAIKSVLGKVSKAIATTMSLDENALLKNMISGIDVNDGNKVPSSAYIHSLVERIGMGTALEGGFDNLTAGLNSVNNNLSNKFKNTADNGYTQLSQLMDVGAWNKPFVFDIPYTSSLAPAKNNTVGIAERGMLHAFDYSGKHFYCVDSLKGWQESPYALKSDLFAYNWISNPNTCTTPFSVVNGWSPDLANVPDDAKNTWNSLQTIWVYPAEIGDLTKQRLQILITGNNTLHTRMYANGNFSNWS